MLIAGGQDLLILFLGSFLMAGLGGLGAGAGEVGVFREEAIAGMDRLRARLARHRRADADAGAEPNREELAQLGVPTLVGEAQDHLLGVGIGHHALEDAVEHEVLLHLVDALVQQGLLRRDPSMTMTPRGSKPQSRASDSTASRIGPLSSSRKRLKSGAINLGQAHPRRMENSAHAAHAHNHQRSPA